MRWLVLSGVLLFVFRNQVKKGMNFVSNEVKIRSLHPDFIPVVRRFMDRLDQEGITVRITEGMRSFERQGELYNQVPKVTNAKPGQSYHNYGLAIDIVPIVNGKVDWNALDVFDKVGMIGKSVGLRWGGDFKSLKDRPHFEYAGLHWSKLLSLKEAGAVTDGFVNLS